MRTLALALALLLPAPALASTWEPPRQVAHEDDFDAQFSSLSLAGAPDGRSLLVWATRSRRPRILAVDVDAGGRFSTPRALSPAGARVSAPLAALGNGGEAVVAWRAGTPKQRQVQVAVRPAGGDFGAGATITRGPGRAVLTSLAMAADGRALLAWARRSGRDVWGVEVAARPAGGTFSDPVKLGRGVARGAHVAVAPTGEAVVAWTESRRRDSPPRVHHAVSTLPAAPVRAGAVSPPGAFAPLVAAEAGGGAVMAWLQSRSRLTTSLEAARRPSGGAFGPPQRLQARAYDHDVALAAGHALVAWSTTGRRLAVRVAQAPPGGAFGAAQTLSDPGSAAWGPEVRAGGGRAVVIWQDTPQRGNRSGVVAGVDAPLGAPFPPPVQVSEPNGILQIATQPRLSVAPDGAALAAYVNYGLDGHSGSGQLALARLAPAAG